MQKPIEKIFRRPEQPGMVGDGFRVYNYIPGRFNLQRRLSPFLMLDFNPAYDFGPTEQTRGVDVHPHKGFETVTIAYKGSVAHFDSAGNSGVIHPGDVQWMTAGAGILHKEFHEEQFARRGGPFEVVQLWVNLPAKFKSEAPHYQALTADMMGLKKLDNQAGTVRIIAGTYEGIKGPAATYTDINLFDMKLNSGADIAFNLPPGHTSALLVIEGNVHVNGDQVQAHEFVLFKNEGEEVLIQAEKDSVLLVMSGTPIDEPIASYGPFVMNTQQEIVQAIQDMQAGKFGTLA